MRIGQENRSIEIDLVVIEICVCYCVYFCEGEEGGKRVVEWFYFGG